MNLFVIIDDLIIDYIFQPIRNKLWWIERREIMRFCVTGMMFCLFIKIFIKYNEGNLTDNLFNYIIDLPVLMFFYWSPQVKSKKFKNPYRQMKVHLFTRLFILFMVPYNILMILATVLSMFTCMLIVSILLLTCYVYFEACDDVPPPEQKVSIRGMRYQGI